MSGRVVAVTGPAAAGKSTIATALQAELTREGSLWLFSGLDAFADSLRRDWASFEGNGGPFAERGFVYERDADDGLTLKLGIDGRRVFRAFHRSVASIAESGVNVVCETVVYDKTDWDDWVETLKPITNYWVRLSAPLAVLESREMNRPQAVRGLARGMMAKQPVGDYDLEVDTSIEDVDEIVERVVSLIS